MINKNQALIGQAVNLFQAGLVRDAETILLQVLKSQSNNLPALEILGLIKASQGNPKESAAYLKRAVHINPSNPSTQYNLAKALSEIGDDIAAIPHHEKATKLVPTNSDAWINYGKSLVALNNHEQAIFAFDKALLINPKQVDSRLNKGIALISLGLLTDSLHEFDLVLELERNNFVALLKKGAILFELKRFNESLQHLEAALEIQQNDFDALLLKARVLYSQSRFSDALSVMQDALDIEPNSADALSNTGAILNGQKRYIEAIPFFAKALMHNNNFASAYANLGMSYDELSRHKDALENYDFALLIDPDIELILGARLRLKQILADWHNYNIEVNQIVNRIRENKLAITPFGALSIIDSPEIQFLCSVKWASKVSHIEALDFDIGTLQKNNYRIRIAYFSADFKSHPVGNITSELFQLHDRTQFEIYAFSLYDAGPTDATRERLKDSFDHFIDVDQKTDIEIALLARQLGIDIAVDLGGYTASARIEIFKYRAAPIQVNYLGYPGTLGTTSYDFIVADPVVIPADSYAFYSEKVVSLSGCYMVDDSRRLPTPQPFSREDFGLPKDGVVFCCFNNSYKFNPEVVVSWSQILNNVSNSVLWLSANNLDFQSNLYAAFLEHAVSSDRIVFAERIDSMGDHLSRLMLADIFLDTWPFNAHSTALDALKVGLPIITLIGKSFPARVAASLLYTAGMPELVAETKLDYQQLAIELGRNSKKLAQVKSNLQNRLLTSSLFDTPLFARKLESAYLQMHGRLQANLPPENIEIS